jgi:acyl-lipid omega-6 desaturase (Delta-12 desaturase)
MKTITDKSIQADRSWEKIIMQYNRPDLIKSIWQLLNTFIPYAGLWFLMYLSLQYSYWITLLLSLPAAGLLVRLFIIFHDCGHGSFFRSKKANDYIGKLIGIFVFTPYSQWHFSHRVHHATAGNLDKRGVGDVWTLTVDEYLGRSKKERFLYRMYRHPLVMFVFGSVFMILYKNRFAHKQMNRSERLNLYATNSGVLVVAVLMSLLIGVKAYLLIQIPVVLIAHIAGIWLFYIQHQFEDVTWDRNQRWDYKEAAISGSSYLKLPAVLQWFTGNIGFHHVHHLSSRIPNYNLARCHYENAMFKEIKPITLYSSLRTLPLRLWDESSRKLISFRSVTALQQKAVLSDSLNG